jgi:hypothetical protein
MDSIKARRPSSGLVISIIALVVATAGTTYAITLPKKSVGPQQLKSKSVTPKKLARGAVTAAKLGPVIRRGVDYNVQDGSFWSGEAACRQGERLLSGGAELVPPAADVPITISRPGRASAAPLGTRADSIDQLWYAEVYNPLGGSGELTLRVYALCLR